MKPYPFEISNETLKELKSRYPNIGKNSHIGKIAVEIVKLYFLNKNKKATFNTKIKGVDIEVAYLGKKECYEIKGTADNNFSWNKLYVSGTPCYKGLIAGTTTLIRVTNVGELKMNLFFIKYSEHFTLISEPRWKVRKLNNT